ncbi:MAG: uridylate kinase [Hyphomicrobiales bacterium]|nr:uridylate kinase [Hyphomicrobiales bacterium]
MSGAAPLTIVKLGGAVAASGGVSGWLAALRAGGQAMVLVPGGGQFADAVRASQRALGYDDALAHDLALVAMNQLGRVLVNLTPGLRLATSLPQIRAHLAQGLTPVWSVVPLARRAGVPQSWDTTSDTLALWLAQRLKPARLLLIKARDADPQAATLDAAQQEGLVDRAFASQWQRGPCKVFVAGPGALATAAGKLRDGDMPGVILVPAARGRHGTR